MGFIYLVKNKINNKIYIGKTKNTIETRWIQHKNEAKRLKPNVYFVRALHKYGIDNFEVSKLEECDNELLNERERYYIKLYNSNNKEIGYNSTNGGDGAEKYSPEEIYKLWQEGLLRSEISEKLKCCPQTVSLTLRGLGVTEEEIRSRAQKKVAETKKKGILQYDLNGNFINRYNCLQDIESSFGFSESSIRRACNSKMHMAHGYIWCHEEDNKDIQDLINETIEERTDNPIEQYTLSGELVRKYSSIAEAAQSVGAHMDTIASALKNQAYIGKGFLWRYQNDDETIEEKMKRNNSKGDYKKIKINQYDLNGNFIATHNSAAEAAIAVGKPGNGSSIIKACRGKLKTAYKFKWSYADN